MDNPGNSFLSKEELESMPFKSLGENVLISKKSSFYGINNISIGNNTRIDDFCVLSGEIRIGSHVHISAYCALYGKHGIVIKDHSGISPRCTVISASDDFGGDYLIGPMQHPSKTKVLGGRVLLEKYVQIGAGTIIFPNLVIGEGSVVGAMSLVNKSLEDWGIYLGIPARKLKDRSKGLLGKI